MICGRIELETLPLEQPIVKISARILNESPLPTQMDNHDAVLMRTFASTHTILHAPGGKFVSLLDPDSNCVALARDCTNIWQLAGARR